MVEFIYHFESLVKEKKGKLLDTNLSADCGFVSAIFPVETYIQKRDRITGGAIIKLGKKQIELRRFIYRHICQSGFVKPVYTQSHIYKTHEVERFVIDLFGHIDGLTYQTMADTAKKYKAAKAGTKPLTLHMITAMVDRKIYRPDTKQLLSHYISEEDQRNLNPLGDHARRIRNALIIDRFDAVHAISAMARDTYNPRNKWILMELAGHLLWEEDKVPELDDSSNLLNNLFSSRKSSVPKED